jgi:hypothetical protein
MSVLISTDLHTSTCFGCGWTVTHLSPFYGPFHDHVSQCVWIETYSDEPSDMAVFVMDFDDSTGCGSMRRVSGDLPTYERFSEFSYDDDDFCEFDQYGWDSDQIL